MWFQLRPAHVLKRCAVIFLLFLLAVPAYPVRAEAGSCKIEFTTSSSKVKRGDIFTVVCQVSSDVSFLDVSFEIDYDDSRMEFIKGGSKVSGGYGELTVDSSGNSEETNSKTFSLQFMAQGKGAGMISVKGAPSVVDADGNEFSTSSNMLSIQVTKNGAATKNESESSIGKTDKPETGKKGKKEQASVSPGNSLPQEGAENPENPPEETAGQAGQDVTAAETEQPSGEPDGQGDMNGSDVDEPIAGEETGQPAAEETAKTSDRQSGGNITAYVLAGVIVVIAIIFICVIFLI